MQKAVRTPVVLFSVGVPLVLAAVIYSLRLEARIDVHDTRLKGVDKVFVEVQAQNGKIIEQYDRINRRLSRIEGQLDIRPRGGIRAQ